MFCRPMDSEPLRMARAELTLCNATCLLLVLHGQSRLSCGCSGFEKAMMFFQDVSVPVPQGPPPQAEPRHVCARAVGAVSL